MWSSAKTASRVGAAALGVAACVTGRPVSPPPGAPGAGSLAVAAHAAPAASSAPARGAPVAPSFPPAVAVAPAPVSTSTFATTKTDPSWAACVRVHEAAARDVSSEVAVAAKACEQATKMKLVGATLTGRQADQDAPQSFAFEASANHCYRVYARASDGIRALYLVVKDSAGVAVGRGSTDDSSPVVLQDGGVCFTRNDHANVVVSVGMGAGEYALQIWRD
jgi:hypothetical protein